MNTIYIQNYRQINIIVNKLFLTLIIINKYKHINLPISQWKQARSQGPDICLPDQIQPDKAKLSSTQIKMLQKTQILFNQLINKWSIKFLKYIVCIFIFTFPAFQKDIVSWGDNKIF